MQLIPTSHVCDGFFYPPMPINIHNSGSQHVLSNNTYTYRVNDMYDNKMYVIICVSCVSKNVSHTFQNIRNTIGVFGVVYLTVTLIHS